MGSGTRLKLIEAMASGRAVVSTPVGAEGYPVRHYEHLLLANTPQEFSAAVISLLSRDSLREQIAAAGREFARQYDYRVIVPKFLKIYQMATVSEHT
jgi:glycosyltransferase involved in cell wall biosynthesis